MKASSRFARATTLALFCLGTFSFGADHASPGVNADEALAKLKEGNSRYAAATKTEGKPTAEMRKETAQAQHPFAIIVGCADSRTSPEIIFDQNLGALFVVRTAGNLVDDHALGSIEYAVEHLGARLVVVLGHERCGAVKAALASATAPGHVNSLVHDIQPAVNATKGASGDITDATIAKNASLVAEKIRKEAELGEAGKAVKVLSAVYDLDTGVVSWANQ